MMIHEQLPEQMHDLFFALMDGRGTKAFFIHVKPTNYDEYRKHVQDEWTKLVAQDLQTDNWRVLHHHMRGNVIALSVEHK